MPFTKPELKIDGTLQQMLQSCIDGCWDIYNNATYKIKTLYEGNNDTVKIPVHVNDLYKCSWIVVQAYRYDYNEGDNVMQFYFSPRIFQDVSYGASKISVAYCMFNTHGDVIPGVIVLQRQDDGYIHFFPGEVAQVASNKVGVFKVYGLEGGVAHV